MADEELLHAYRTTGNNEWFGYLLQRYTLLLLGVAMKYLKERDAAEDAVQHVFLKALTHLPGEPILNFKGWLYILMRNHCLQVLRDRTFTAGDEAMEFVADESEANDAHLLKEHTLEQMTASLEELSEEQRTSITLFYLQKQSYEQIIEQTGFTFMQVKSYIQNGKRNLKNTLLNKLRRNDR